MNASLIKNQNNRSRQPCAHKSIDVGIDQDHAFSDRPFDFRILIEAIVSPLVALSDTS